MYIATHNGSCGIGEIPDDAYSDLKENSTRDPDINEVLFFEAKPVKVKQTIIIIDSD